MSKNDATNWRLTREEIRILARALHNLDLDLSIEEYSGDSKDYDAYCDKVRQLQNRFDAAVNDS